MFGKRKRLGREFFRGECGVVNGLKIVVQQNSLDPTKKAAPPINGAAVGKIWPIKFIASASRRGAWSAEP